MAKMKVNFDFKKFFLEKGEKIGLGVGALALVLLAGQGGMSAFSTPPAKKHKETIDSNAQAVRTKLAAGSDEPDKIAPEVFLPPNLRQVAMNEFPCPNPLFDPQTGIVERRMRPRILPVTEARADYVRGSISAYDIIRNGDSIQYAVIVGRPVTQAQSRNINILKRNADRKAQGKSLLPVPRQQPPQVAQGNPPAGGSNTPGGPPGTPPPAQGGLNVDIRNNNPTNKKFDELQIEYMDVTDKEFDRATLATTLLPRRMAVVTGSIPYKKQIEEFQRALRLRNVTEIAADASAVPAYFGMQVERQVLDLDGKTVRVDWQPLDFENDYMEILAKLNGMEPENHAYKDLVPAYIYQLVQPRPKLIRPKAGYGGDPVLPSLTAAADAMIKNGPPPTLNPRQDRMRGRNVDIFNPQVFEGDQQPGSAAPGGGGFMPPSGGAEGRRGPLGGAGQPTSNASLAEAWMLRFIDITIEPGFCYKYRIKLRVVNPNLDRKDVANPSIAQGEHLYSDWYELPDVLTAPPEDYMYANIMDVKQGAEADKTTIVLQRWLPTITLSEGISRAEPIGEWVMAEVAAKRGQMIGEVKPMLMPLWSMLHTAFIFRDKMNAAVRPKGSPPPKAGQPNAKVDFRTEHLLVDFDGGKGNFYINKKTVVEEAGLEVLILMNSGSNFKLISRNSATDRADPDGNQRVKDWLEWLIDVRSATERAPQQDQGGGRGGRG